MATKTVSIAKGGGSLRHNNREFFADNIDRFFTSENITYVRESLTLAYEKNFSKAIEEYNQKQKRSDRRIDGVQGYMNQIRNSKNGEKLFYENIVQIGNSQDTNRYTEDFNTCKEILDKYMQTFQERNPNLYVFNAVMHLDESCPHLHIDYIPIANGYQKGLRTRNALSKALRGQGIRSDDTRYSNNTIVWQKKEKDYLEKLMLERGIDRAEEKGLKQKKLTLDEYKAVVKDKNNTINALSRTIDAKPTLLQKDKVVISKADLEDVEKKANATFIKEKHLDELLEIVKEQQEETRKNLRDSREYEREYFNKISTIREVEEENQSLKQENQQLKEKIDNLSYLQDRNKSLEKENISLKKQVKEMKEDDLSYKFLFDSELKENRLLYRVIGKVVSAFVVLVNDICIKNNIDLTPKENALLQGIREFINNTCFNRTTRQLEQSGLYEDYKRVNQGYEISDEIKKETKIAYNKNQQQLEDEEYSISR